MADQAQDSVWPLPKFYFKVSFSGSTASFQEVSGLETDTQAIEYRHGDSSEFSTVKMPGISKTGSIILKKGVFVNDNYFRTWYDAIKMNVIKRETLTIQLLNENESPTMTWTLTNAWPTKITGIDLESNAHEIVIETLELAHEGITLENVS